MNIRVYIVRGTWNVKKEKIMYLGSAAGLRGRVSCILTYYCQFEKSMLSYNILRLGD